MAPGAASKRQVRPRPWTALVLAVLLLAMALGQLASLGDFVDIVHTYDVAGDAAPALAGLLLALEIGGGLGLLVFRRSPAWVGRAAGALGLGAAVLWSALAAQAFARGLGVPNCGCFGRFLGQELRWWVLVEDLEFLLLGWWAAAGAGLPLAVPRRRSPASAGLHWFGWFGRLTGQDASWSLHADVPPPRSAPGTAEGVPGDRHPFD
jgi:hypothetical protein